MTTTIKIMILASHYREDHVTEMHTYHKLNKAASTWNTALFNSLKKYDVTLHIIQFYPVRNKYTFTEENITYHYLPKIPKIDGFTSRIKSLRIKYLVRKIKPDVIHGIGSEHGHVYSATAHGLPCIVTIHGYLKRITKLAGHRNLLQEMFLVKEEKIGLNRANSVIALNEYMKNELIEAGCNTDNIHTIPNPINNIFLNSDTSMERNIDIIMVGTLHELKNYHVALQIFNYLKNELDKTPKIIIVGNSTAASKEYTENLYTYSQQHDLHNIKFIGNIDQKDLCNLYSQSRILLHISAFETDSMALSEAVACGVYPVVNPVAALKYRVENNINGSHIAPHDTRQSAITLKSLLEGSLEYYDRHKEAEKMRTAHSPSVIAEKTYNAYISTIKKAN